MQRIKRLKEWVKRYWKAEVCSTTLAVLFPMIIAGISDNNVCWMTVGGVIGDNIGYYGYFFIAGYKGKGSLEKLKLMTMEFGIGEVLDSFLLRPLFMYLALTFIPNQSLAIMVGKLCADITFYLPTIISHEKWVKKHLN